MNPALLATITITSALLGAFGEKYFGVWTRLENLVISFVTLII